MILACTVPPGVRPVGRGGHSVFHKINCIHKTFSKYLGSRSAQRGQKVYYNIFYEKGNLELVMKYNASITIL